MVIDNISLFTNTRNLIKPHKIVYASIRIWNVLQKLFKRVGTWRIRYRGMENIRIQRL